MVIFAMKEKFFLCQYLIWVMVLLQHLHGYKSCIEKEREALLDLKKYIISITEEGLSDFVLPTWTNDTKSNCCQWEGLKCNGTSGRILELSIGQLYLKETSLLNLSMFHPFEDVQSLKLSANEDRRFSEDAFNQFNGLFDNVEGYKSLKRLRNLETLDLSSNGFNNSIFPFINAATSLTTLFLRDNNMDGHFPAKELKDLTKLELLDLSKNLFNGSIPIQELYALEKLKAFDLSDNQFSGSMDLHGICSLKNMQEIDLSRNKLVGQFPLCLTSLTGLRVLDLSANQLTGTIPSSLGNLISLEYLSLVDNNFEGVFSLGSLANLSKLKVLKLDSRSNSFRVEYEKSLWKSKFQLSVIILRSCKLAKVPYFLRYQKDLRQVDLSNNQLSGSFPSWLLANNTKLEVLFLQNNSFTKFQLPDSPHHLLFLKVSDNKFDHLFPENIGWILPHLRYMSLASNGFKGSLPYSLGNMRSIEYLDISHNGFDGELPETFVKGCYSMRILKLSHNKLSGEILSKSTNFTRIKELSMDNNMFTGTIGQGLRSFKDLTLLDISYNNLTGFIPSWIGELQMLHALLISNNLLEGEIPISLFNISNLQLLDLSGNNLSGRIPPHVGSGYGKVILLLQDNNLSGDIPSTLLKRMEILDLRNNIFSGNIPEFIDTERISILLLRGNNFTGDISRRVCSLRNIHLLDLAQNRFNGSIPSCLSNTSFGSDNVDASYDYDFRLGYTFNDFEDRFFEPLLVVDQFSMDYKASTPTKIEFATKHRYDSYMGGNLEYFFGIDLSENELSGEIPIELGGLMRLRALNLSHNNLSGVISKSFSGMKSIESLDLSFNRLQGHIPRELTDLSSLAVFKVAYNNLSGVIPQGKQFDTFDVQSYLGNPLLCGKPTNISCDDDNTFQESDDGVEDDDEYIIDMESFYWSFVAVFVTIFVGIFASLSFDSPWKRTWFYVVDVFIHKVKNLFCKPL